MKIKRLIATLILCLSISQSAAAISELNKAAAISAIGCLAIAKIIAPIVSKYLVKNLTACDQETSDKLRQILIKYTGDDQVNLDKINQITFKESYEYAAIPYANTIIVKSCDRSEQLQTGALLHELGHIQDNMLKYEAIVALYSGLLSLIGAKTKPFSRQRIAFAICVTITNLLIGRLIERWAEIKADNFAVECLKKHQDYQTLETMSDFFNNPQDQSDYEKLQQKYRFFTPLIQLLGDGHPPAHQRAQKFKSAAQEVKASLLA